MQQTGAGNTAGKNLPFFGLELFQGFRIFEINVLALISQKRQIFGLLTRLLRLIVLFFFSIFFVLFLLIIYK